MVYPNIRNLREDQDLTQKEVADYLGIAQNTYSQYETGKIMVPPKILSALADYYNTSIDYLMGRTDFPRPYPRSFSLKRANSFPASN